MMKKNMVPLLAIALVVALVSTGLFYALVASKLGSASDNASADSQKRNIVVAARKLSRGVVLAGSDLQIVEIKGSGVFGGSFTNPEQVIGATVMDPFEANQVITKTALVSAKPSDTGDVPAGMRAITVHILESGGVLALLRPGSRVDIQAISAHTNPGLESATALRTILQNIEVLAVASQPEQVALRFSAPMVTVLVRAEDSDLLAVADAGARLRLALRNRLDQGTPARSTIALPTVFLPGRDDVPPARQASAARAAAAPGKAKGFAFNPLTPQPSRLERARLSP